MVLGYTVQQNNHDKQISMQAYNVLLLYKIKIIEL